MCYQHTIADDFTKDLDLASIVAGMKYKVQDHHARNLLKRLPKDGDEYLRVTVHLEIVEKAAMLCNIEEVPTSSLPGLLQEVIIKHGIAPPEHLQRALLKLAVDTHLQKPLDNESVMEECFRLIQPCSAKCAGFDVLAPTLAGVSIDVASKGVEFQNVTMNQVILPLVRMGEAAASRLSKICKVFLSGIEHIAEEDTTACDEVLAPLFDVAYILRALKAIVSDSLHDRVACIDEVRVLHANSAKSHRKWIVTVANEVSRVDWTWARVTELVRNEDVCVDAAVQIGVHEEALSSLLEEDPLAMAATLSEVCQDLSKWVMSLPKNSIDSFIETVHDKTKHFLQIVDGNTKHNTFTNDELRTLQKHVPRSASRSRATPGFRRTTRPSSRGSSTSWPR